MNYPVSVLGHISTKTDVHFSVVLLSAGNYNDSRGNEVVLIEKKNEDGTRGIGVLMKVNRNK